jgi:hypothetical protein
LASRPIIQAPNPLAKSKRKPSKPSSSMSLRAYSYIAAYTRGDDPVVAHVVVVDEGGSMQRPPHGDVAPVGEIAKVVVEGVADILELVAQRKVEGGDLGVSDLVDAVEPCVGCSVRSSDQADRRCHPSSKCTACWRESTSYCAGWTMRRTRMTGPPMLMRTPSSLLPRAVTLSMYPHSRYAQTFAYIERIEDLVGCPQLPRNDKCCSMRRVAFEAESVGYATLGCILLHPYGYQHR